MFLHCVNAIHLHCAHAAQRDHRALNSWLYRLCAPAKANERHKTALNLWISLARISNEGRAVQKGRIFMCCASTSSISITCRPNSSRCARRAARDTRMGFCFSAAARQIPCWRRADHLPSRNRNRNRASRAGSALAAMANSTVVFPCRVALPTGP